MYVTYILFSESLKKYYIGYTENFERRLNEHNNGKSKYTKIGLPWKVIKVFDTESKNEAQKLENKIKKRGCKRFLEDLLIKQSSLK